MMGCQWYALRPHRLGAIYLGGYSLHWTEYAGRRSIVLYRRVVVQVFRLNLWRFGAVPANEETAG